jgi:rfaE bifunctional protein nucleotidyltransferase chain/domain
MERAPKVRELHALADELERLRADRRVVHCHGVFDLLHIGHIRHLEEAKKLGDLLVVTVTPDRYVNKGACRPAFPEHLRAEAVASLSCVDHVAVNHWPSAVETIRLLRPHVFVKGSEFQGRQDTTGHIAREEEAVRQAGGELAFTQDVTYSSSGLINQYLAGFPAEVRDYLAGLLTRHSSHDVLKPLHNAAHLNVLCVGEAILDEYQYCETMGKAGKEPVLAARYLGKDLFAGGVLACANHVAGFCERVDVLTFLGEQGGHEAFVRAMLRPNVGPHFLFKAGAPTIRRASSRSTRRRSSSRSTISTTTPCRRSRTPPCASGCGRCCRSTTWSSSPTTATACWGRGPSTCCAGTASSWRSTRSPTPATTASTRYRATRGPTTSAWPAASSPWRRATATSARSR